MQNEITLIFLCINKSEGDAVKEKHSFVVATFVNLILRTFMLKQLFIPVAAFAVTVTAASAFTGGNIADKLDLTEEQTTALETAHEMRQSGADKEAVLAILNDAGIDKEAIRAARKEVHTDRHEKREAVHTALENGDYNAFMEAVAESPLAEKITSEADFARLVEAHELKEDGDYEGAQEIFSELGIERAEKGERKGHHKNRMNHSEEEQA